MPNIPDPGLFFLPIVLKRMVLVEPFSIPEIDLTSKAFSLGITSLDYPFFPSNNVVVFVPSIGVL